MSASIITRVAVEGLFGRFTYTLPSHEVFSNTAILYGDNGVGKSTILRLVFHLLSAAPRRGHRTALQAAEFRSLRVWLSSGVLFSATRAEGANDPILNLAIERDGEVLVEWPYATDNPETIFYGGGKNEVVFYDGKSYRILNRKKGRTASSKKSDKILRGEEAYLARLSELAPKMYSVNAERRLDSDAVPDSNDELELRRLISNESKKINDLVNRSREIALTQAMSAASRWVQEKYFRSANQGSTNVQNVYENVLYHISTDYLLTKGMSEVSSQDLIKRIEAIEAKTTELAEYDLAAAVDMSVFKKSLRSKTLEHRRLSAGLITPYIDSVSSRLDALDVTYKLVDRFVKTLNTFLNGKAITYKVSRGFSILTDNGVKLEASQLSSGEQQLLLMFCYALTARDTPSVFIIDEPEISLNVKWQRQLIRSLIAITDNSETQFILASHSLELIAQHRSNVVKLENLL